MSSLASKPLHEAQVKQMEQLECKIFRITPPPAQLEVTLEEIENAVAASAKGVERETNRAMVEIEDKLSCYKAEEYVQLLLRLQDVHRLLSSDLVLPS